MFVFSGYYNWTLRGLFKHIYNITTFFYYNTIFAWIFFLLSGNQFLKRN